MTLQELKKIKSFIANVITEIVEEQEECLEIIKREIKLKETDPRNGKKYD